MSSMSWITCMQIAGRLQWLWFELAGLLLNLWFLTSGSVEILARATPGAQAAGTNIRSSGGGGKRRGKGTTFWGKTGIRQAEDLCCNITSFCGGGEVKGGIRGEVTAFKGGVIN